MTSDEVNAAGNTYALGNIELWKPCCTPVPHMSIKELSVGYGNKPVLRKISLDIYKGCITALIGPSGCGKTTFLSTLNRLIDLTDGSYVRGMVHFDGHDIVNDRIDILSLRRRIGFIFQKPNPFPLSIRRNLDLPLKEFGIRNKKERMERIESALKDVGLWDEVLDRLDDSALALSGGQQQRLCIARALILEPEIILMDEPCSSLDPVSSKVVEDLILRLQNRLTVVIVTHNLAQARRIANYTAFFWMIEQVGTLIEFGHCQQVFENPSHCLTVAYIQGRQG